MIKKQNWGLNAGSSPGYALGPVRLPNNILKRILPLRGGPHKSSTDIFRQRTSWRTATTSNRGRALPLGPPIIVGRTRLWPRRTSCPNPNPNTVWWSLFRQERDQDRFVLRPSAITCAAPAPRVPTVALFEPTTATRATSATVSAVPAQLVAPQAPA